MSSIEDGLAKLGVRRLLLAIHDVSFPSDPDEDLGRGSPATRAAGRLFAYLQQQGFTGLQLGPQGQTSRDNPSPYDATVFARNVANLGLASLRADGELAGLVDDDAIAAAVVRDANPQRAQHGHAYAASHALVAQAHAALLAGARPDLRAQLAVFRAAHARWLEPTALHAAICETHHGASYRDWPATERDLWAADTPVTLAHRAALAVTHAVAIEQYAFGQLLVHLEHARVRRSLAPLGLALYGDLQVGYADADMWANAAAFIPRYRMGAPPSRTNPEGQPWGYAVLDPAQYGGRARDLVVARADKAFAEYDSLRLDHPHGLVCPWVYDGHAADPMRAVRAGARLFESPDLPDHPGLAAYAIARADQLDRAQPRHADSWVKGLSSAQIDRYAVLLDALVASAVAHGRNANDLSCEVLSTMPAPLAAMLPRYGLGRWRVTQKANLSDPTDVYRTETVAREDWLMLGNHDTASIFALIRAWTPPQHEAWARHLAARLALRDPSRLASPGFLATAMIAELFVSRAENVSIFFADLFGFEDRFNVPGLVDSANWSLRLPPDFEHVHAERLARGAAIDLALAVELALAATVSG